MDGFIFLWLGLAVVIGIGGASRGRSGFGWFLLAAVISPLLALILLVLLPSLKTVVQKPTPETHVKCPDCRELILKDARVCRYCGVRLTPASEQSSPSTYGPSGERL